MTAVGAVHILPTADMETAMRFWRDVVGCTERFSTPGFSEVAAGRSVICLRRSSNPGGRSGLAVDVADLDRTCAAIAAGGGEVTRPPQDGPVAGLRIAAAVDPDGNGFELTEHRVPPPTV
ncbi:MAG: VOC family protein [Acidimicrobiia bacterium]